MNKNSIISIVVLLFACITAFQAYGQGEVIKQFNPVNTGATSLTIAPDARGAGMGDIGAATDPDVNSQFWNASKYAFAFSDAGIGLSYTPWLSKLVNDIYLLNLSGYLKFGPNKPQAMSLSLRYFSLGSITLTNQNGDAVNSINPFEMAVDLGYSRKLSENFSMGVVMRYIYSDLGFQYDESGSATGSVKGASAFGADISWYYTFYPIIARNECQWSWGMNISNIGSKLAYDNGNQPAFLPTNLKIGTTFLFPIADKNTISINVDANKKLVPTMPQEYQYKNEDGTINTDAYNAAREEYYNMSPFEGIAKSFYDAPGGFEEEMREINFSVGLEYSYNRMFSLRAGYYWEDELKGNRQFFAFGASFAYSIIQVDAAYLLATAASSLLDQTLRFTLAFDLEGIKNLIK